LRVFSTKHLDLGYASRENPIELTVSETAAETKHKIKFTDSIWDAEGLEQDTVFYFNFDK
jgi:hypothetical protein